MQGETVQTDSVAGQFILIIGKSTRSQEAQKKPGTTRFTDQKIAMKKIKKQNNFLVK